MWIQISLSPIAFLTRTAATVESTPPLNAQIALELPTEFLIFSSCSPIKFWDVQSPLHLQISNKKFLMILSPSSV